MPRPLNRLVAASAISHGYAAWSEGTSVREPDAWSCSTTPLIDGIRQSIATIPSQTISGNAPVPRATGGQAIPARATATGPSMVRPTTRSSGPPGR